MSQHDMDLANQTRTAFRQDASAALVALAGNSSGATQPATMFAYQWWADTTTGLLKIRNAANSAWITVGTLATMNLASLSGATFTGNVALSGSVDLSIPAGRYFYLDGGGDSYIRESSGNVIDVFTGGTNALRLTANGVTITNAAGSAQLSMVYAGFDTYALRRNAGTGLEIYNVTDSRLEMFFDGAGAIQTGALSSAAAGYTAAGDITLPATGAIRAQNTAKAWAAYTVNVGLDDSFNVTSVTDNAVGNWTVNFTNALSNANYALSVVGAFGAELPVFIYTSKTTTALTVQAMDSVTLALIDPASFTVTVIGE